jgi:hypothetical protein
VKLGDSWAVAVVPEVVEVPKLGGERDLEN